MVAPEHPDILKSVAIGLGILECFDSKRRVLDLLQLTALLGLDARQLSRYISVMLARGYLEQTAAQDYRLGARAGDAALVTLDTLALRRGAEKAMRSLRARTGYTTSLVALDGANAVYLTRLAGSRRGQHEIDDGLGIGARLPAHLTAAGKILLAHLRPMKRKDQITELVLAHCEAKNLTSKKALYVELMNSRRAGFAVSDDDGRQSIAAPVRGDDGTVVAAIEITMPASKVSFEALIESFGPQLLNATKTIIVTTDDFLVYKR
jgi:IclR family pca regulon transcriptional regulator